MQADTPSERHPGTRLTSFVNDGLTFDVVDEGPLDGTPIVLLHGFPQTAAQWSRLTPFLHERGYRTIAPDQRGYSPGARPRGRFAYRVSALAGDTAALITALGGEPVHLVGHDWGSTVAWTTAARYPHLIRTLTSVPSPSVSVTAPPGNGTKVSAPAISARINPRAAQATNAVRASFL